ncbi:coiled-coil domain-containing protein 78 [Dunckerocampus dactyliophorus]|uniref:coiled-coil domain-containing protein 78 n=1 Tax=Dunckerocampus dactyliophorus TaxID=161453 RepID=UPI00240519B0|nr:coiled-coil domain-containing protein 78 [Dunckerocampus dactyliophorus]
MNTAKSSSEAQDKMQVEKLQDTNERLSVKVDYLESRVAHLSTSNTDLSTRLVQSEEEKLKISKELVEEKVQINKMRAQFEEETFQLKNKILNQKGELTELETERDKLLVEIQSAQGHPKVFENNSQEYASLKKNYLSLAEAHHKELAQNKELSAALLALAQAQDALRSQLAEQHQRAEDTTQGLHGELDRVRGLISRMLHSRVKPDPAALNTEQKNMERNNEIKDMMEDMKRSYEEEQRKLKDKIESMGKEQQIQNSQQKPSEQSLTCLCCQSQLKQVQEDNSRLQLQVKELNEQYRARLVCYLRDITEYIDSLGGNKMLSEGNKLKAFVDNMLRDVRSSYRAREEQLATAARAYKKNLQRITKTHHALMNAYRAQREQILSKPDKGLEPGPPEANFNVEPTELREESEKVLHQLELDKSKLEGQRQVTRNQVAVLKTPVGTSICQEMPKLEKIFEESWLVIREQLKEITDSTLGSYEREHKLLITRATVAEAQVSQLQDYIDNHLDRYKQEVAHLSLLHGKEEPSRTQSTH